MFGLGYAEMMIVGVVAVLLFGGRLPQVARSMGRSLTEFKKGMQDLQTDMSDVMDTSSYHNDSVQTEPTGSVGYDPGPSDSEPGPIDHHEEYKHEEYEDPKFEPPTSPPTVDSKLSESEATATETS